MLTDTIVGKIKQLPETVKSEVLTLAGLTASLNVTLTAADGAPDPGVNAETVGPKLSSGISKRLITKKVLCLTYGHEKGDYPSYNRIGPASFL